MQGGADPFEVKHGCVPIRRVDGRDHVEGTPTEGAGSRVHLDFPAEADVVRRDLTAVGPSQSMLQLISIVLSPPLMPPFALVGMVRAIIGNSLPFSSSRNRSSNMAGYS